MNFWVETTNWMFNWNFKSKIRLQTLFFAYTEHMSNKLFSKTNDLKIHLNLLYVSKKKLFYVTKITVVNYECV